MHFNEYDILLQEINSNCVKKSIYVRNIIIVAAEGVLVACASCDARAIHAAGSALPTAHLSRPSPIILFISPISIRLKKTLSLLNYAAKREF